MILSQSAQKIVTDRYFLEGVETQWSELAKRVARSIASVETNSDEWAEKFEEMLNACKFIPAGRILRNAGRSRGSLFNCYHLPIGDSIDEIGDCAANALKLWSDGGGVGINFSSLRPEGSEIRGLGGKSSGLVSFMEAIDGLAACIESGGSRRAASLGSCDVGHPEIRSFINSKLVDGRISYFNISVNITKSFLEAVLSGSKFPLTFRGKVYDEIQAKKLWHTILQNMVDVAEPGLLVWDNLIKNNSYYFAPITGTNPCGEATLAPFDVCDLGSLVLPKFVDASGRTKWSDIEHTVSTAVRFLDNVIDVNKYRLPQNQRMAQAGRRIGVGVMGLADYLFAKQLCYGSRGALDAVEDLMKCIRDSAYLASIELASEKGAFPAYEKLMYHKASFVRHLPVRIRNRILDIGIRNVTLLALAPTGTISLIPEVCSSIEPLFAKAYKRADRVGERVYIHPIMEKLIRSNEKVPSWFVDTGDLKPEDHLEIQALCQKYTDGAVSKTINVHKDFTVGQLSDVLFEYLFDLKGVTVYRDGARGGQILNRISIDEAKQIVDKSSSSQDTEAVSCASGTCEL